MTTWGPYPPGYSHEEWERARLRRSQPAARHVPPYSPEEWERWERHNLAVIGDARLAADEDDPIAWALEHADCLIEEIVDPWEHAYAIRQRERLARLRETRSSWWRRLFGRGR